MSNTDELVDHTCPVEGRMMIERGKPCNWCGTEAPPMGSIEGFLAQQCAAGGQEVVAAIVDGVPFPIDLVSPGMWKAAGFPSPVGEAH